MPVSTRSHQPVRQRKTENIDPSSMSKAPHPSSTQTVSDLRPELVSNSELSFDNVSVSDGEFRTPLHELHPPSVTDNQQGKERTPSALVQAHQADNDDKKTGEIDEEILESEQLDPKSSKSIIVQAEELARRVWRECWDVVHHVHLPDWLQDNEFLHNGHRPQLNSFWACFKSVFRVHTETGNIWSHLLGFIAFIVAAVYFMSRPSIEVQWQEKAVFSAFFLGAILCLGFSFTFHTVYCHSERIGKLFNKLDYCGIALLTMGSFVPWLYYSFYCEVVPKVIYMVLIFLLGTSCIVVSLWDKFSTPKYRALRAGVFIALGLSGVIPALHVVITDGFWFAVNKAALGWLALMAVLYITGALIYAMRIPERLFPGKFDIWFQSHQIFHCFVVAAAFIHYHGISTIANYRLTFGDCTSAVVDLQQALM